MFTSRRIKLKVKTKHCLELSIVLSIGHNRVIEANMQGGSDFYVF